MTEATTLQDPSYYLENPDELTSEVEAQLFGTAEPEAEPKAEETQAAEEPKPELLAKDGKHTIPYEQLETSRAEAKQAKEELEAMQARVNALEQERADLQAARDAKAAEGQDTSEEDATLAAFDEDYPSISAVQDVKIRRALDARDQTIAELKKQVEALAAVVTPLQANTEEQAFNAHLNAIRTAHADFDQIVATPALKDYAEGLPYKQAIEAMRILDEGNAKEVIKLVTDYKASKGLKPAPKHEEAEERIPTSLSDFPSGAPVTNNEMENFLAMSPTQQMDFAGRNPDKYREFMLSAL